MKDWVVNVTVVLSDGWVVKTRRRPRKSSAGYNMTSLFVGAEGTLGIITEPTLKLAVIPRHTGVAVVQFETIDSAARAASKLIRSGIQLAAMELMDDVQMRLLNRHGSQAVRQFQWDEISALSSKFSGPSQAVVASEIADVQKAVATFNPRRSLFAKMKSEEVDL